MKCVCVSTVYINSTFNVYTCMNTASSIASLTKKPIASRISVREQRKHREREREQIID